METSCGVGILPAHSPNLPLHSCGVSIDRNNPIAYPLHWLLIANLTLITSHPMPQKLTIAQSQTLPNLSGS
jgi:hypothetical protein